jgi:hypothetical protein
MNPEILELHKDTPRIIEPNPLMVEPNESIEIYTGEITLKDEQKNTEYVIEGQVTFNWFPHTESILKGKVTKNYDTFSCNTSTVIINGLEFGKCYITHKSISTNFDYIDIEGIVSDNVVLGDKSIPVDYVTFSIPNMRALLGSNVVKVTDDNITNSASRTTFESNDYIIIIDKIIKHDDLQKKLNDKGGYILLYGGQLNRSDGKPVTFKEAGDVLYTFGHFLSFVNGRLTKPMFLKGIHDDTEIWSDYSEQNIDMYKAVKNWGPKRSDDHLVKLWDSFYQRWNNDDSKTALETAVHWYIEANGGSGYIEGSTIMAQSALELLYNWILIEDKKIMLGRDAENISAANKIRLLLSNMNIENSVPDTLNELVTFVTDSNDVQDAPDAVVLMRNAIIHSQLEKRKRLDNINSMAKYQALELCLWYIEMGILYALKYQGVYRPRNPPPHWDHRLGFVPWVQ